MTLDVGTIGIFFLVCTLMESKHSTLNPTSLSGLVEGRGWSSVLFPSMHKPVGDGLTWNTVYSCNVQWTYGGVHQS